MAKKGSRFTHYSPEFKLQVIEDYLSGQSGGLSTITKKYGLRSQTQIREWTKKYRENLLLLHQDLRGSKSTGRPKITKLSEMTLEEQHAYLKMKNAMLKTLRTLLKE